MNQNPRARRAMPFQSGRAAVAQTFLSAVSPTFSRLRVQGSQAYGIENGQQNAILRNSRQECLRYALGGFLAACALFAATLSHAASALIDVDFARLVARADLVYTNAVERSEDGLPLGNGRAGGLAWTTPAAIHFQINRVDVFGNNSASDSFPERNSDYCGGCGFVDIEFAGFGDTFPTNRTTMRLGCYDGLAAIHGRGVTAQLLAWNEGDVIAIRITDERHAPGSIAINLRALRPPFVRTGSHTATSRLASRDGKLLLTQEFAEGDYFCGSAVAVAVDGRDAALRRANEQEWRLVTAPKTGSFTVLIGSAASFRHDDDLASGAVDACDAASAKTFSDLAESNRDWWREFWSRSFVHLHNDDGVADDLEKNYTYYLYLMAVTSRGKFPTKFNGMLWTTGGDRRQWGGLYWGANQSCLYNNALCAANHLELLDPMFDMYSGMAASCAVAAKQQWDSEGLWLPETVAFDGLAPLPDDIAAEMRGLYLLKKPWDQRSKEFLDYAGTKVPFSSRWNWIGGGRWEHGRWTFSERGGGPYGPVTHTFARGAKIAYQYWLRYEYSLDEAWLRDRAYPMLKGVAEFYRNYPNVRKEADGRFHIHDVNSNESLWGAQDTDEEISAMQGIFPVAIKASELLNTDAELRPAWREFLAQLTPLTRSDDPHAAPSRFTNAAPVWIRGLPPAMPPRDFTSGRPDGNTMPMWFFDLCTLESDAAMFAIGSNTFNGYAGSGTNAARRVGVLSKVPLVAAIMGRADAVEALIPAQFNTNERGGILANRMDLREGPQTTSAQRLGNASDALHTALCSDLPAGPGQPPVIRVFAAWPKRWDAEYTLLARGGFLVTSAMREGAIQFVELQSQLGGECRLRNPWTGDAVLFRNGKKSEAARGSLLKFPTQKGETIVVVRPGTTPDQFKQTVPAHKSR